MAPTPPTLRAPRETRGAPRLHLLNDFNLGAVRAFEEAHAAAVGGRQLLEHADAVGAELRERARVVVGVDGDVLEPVVLLTRLAVDDRRDVELEPVQVDGVAAG